MLGFTGYQNGQYTVTIIFILIKTKCVVKSAYRQAVFGKSLTVVSLMIKGILCHTLFL